MTRLRAFSDEQARLLVNLRQSYEVWMDADREKAALPYDLRRKTVSGREYLYSITDRGGNGQSLGPMTPEREGQFDAYHLRMRKRNPQKRPKDHAQGMALLNAVAQTMALRLTRSGILPR